MSYYNTNSESGETLSRSKERADTMKDQILHLFRENAGIDFTPFEVLRQLNTRSPITSVRRSITDLTMEGFLEKTDKMRIGDYGKQNYCWRLSYQSRLF